MRVGAVDIGTNSMRLLVAESEDGTLREIVRETQVTRLGQGVDATGLLDTDAIERTLTVMESYGATLSEARVDRVRAIATSASRDAANRDEFFDRVEEALGFRPDLVSGEAEAELSFSGARRGLEVEGPVVVCDIGGGSTEFVFGREAVEYARSVNIGSVRLTERVVPDRPAPSAQLAAGREEAETLMADVVLPGRPAAAVGVGGTFTSLAAMNLDLETYRSETVHGSTVSYQDLLSLVEWLSGMTVEETASIPSLMPARAPVILAGAIVAVAACLTIDVGRIEVSEHDLLHGVAWELLGE